MLFKEIHGQLNEIVLFKARKMRLNDGVIGAGMKKLSAFIAQLLSICAVKRSSSNTLKKAFASSHDSFTKALLSRLRTHKCKASA